MLKFNGLLLGVALNLSTTLFCSAEEIRIAAEDSWPPFSDAAGQGISFNLVSAALAETGHSIKIDVLPYARALKYTEMGQLDACWNVTRQASTELMFLFGEEPLLQASASYYYPKDHPLAFQRPAEMPDGIQVGVIIDYEYGEEYAKHQSRFNVIAVPNQEQLIKMLMSHRIEVAIMFDKVAQYTIAKMAISPDQIEKGATNHVSDIYLAFSKQNPDSRQLAADLDQGLRQLKASGQYQQILDNPPLSP